MKLMERNDKELQELASKYGLPKVKGTLTKEKRLNRKRHDIEIHNIQNTIVTELKANTE